jgi:ABC-type transport system involved in multi-copper enzyme maturation permease subunit
MEALKGIIDTDEEILWRSDDPPVNLRRKYLDPWKRELIAFFVLLLLSIVFIWGVWSLFGSVLSNGLDSLMALLLCALVALLFYVCAVLYSITRLILDSMSSTYERLRGWYSEQEISEYASFSAITRRYVVKKSSDTAVIGPSFSSTLITRITDLNDQNRVLRDRSQNHHVTPVTGSPLAAVRSW